MGPDDPAVAVRIIGRRIVEAPVKVVPVNEPASTVVKAAVTIASAAEHMTAAKPAAMESGAAVTKTTAAETTAMKGRATATEAATVKTAAASEATASAAAETAAAMKAASTVAAAMTAADFGRQSVRYMFRGRHRTGIDQGQRLGAFAGRGRQRQYRSSRKPEAADKAALRSWNPHHV
jgi:hypothetical protein